MAPPHPDQLDDWAIHSIGHVNNQNRLQCVNDKCNGVESCRHAKWCEPANQVHMQKLKVSAFLRNQKKSHQTCRMYKLCENSVKLGEK